MTTRSADETRAAGAAFAACLQPGDVVLLSGDLGAGKTQFAQGVASGLGVDEVPTSPTFNIVLSYSSGRLALHHFDLYRLDSASQLEDIGLAEYLESGGACLVEWAEKFPTAFAATWAVEISKVSESKRVIHIAAAGDQSARVGGALGGDDPHAQTVLDLRNGVSQSAELRVAAIPPERPASVSRSPLLDDAVRHFERSEESPALLEESSSQFVLAFDTANEVVAIGVGELDAAAREVRVVATREIAAHRASNTTLVPVLDSLLASIGIARGQIACVCAGRGPGSFTGVRICMAAAKGIASALGVGLAGVSTLDAIAWNAQAEGVRGDMLVVADAMRKEVYPARFALFDDGVRRHTVDRVVKAAALADELAAEGLRAGDCDTGSAADLLMCGDGLVKYRSLYEPFGQVVPGNLWETTGRGLLLAFAAAWRAGDIDPFDARRHDPAFALPVYTRLSDAEENERAKLAQAAGADARQGERDLRTGVQDVSSGAARREELELAPDGGKGRATLHSQAELVAPAGADGVAYRPFASDDVEQVAALESTVMRSDAWNARMVASELGARDRIWWVAEGAGSLVGYAGGLVADGDLQVLKVAVAPAWQRRGIARELLLRVSEDARNLGASTCSLEVRASNAGAQAFYGALGLAGIGTRPGYYSDGEDAAIMQGALPGSGRDVAGMELQHLGCDRGQVPVTPLILAIESSCDETAAAVVDGEGQLLSDVVASQIDFHARFGGVVPEIASRKHIEAICGVCAEALDSAGVGWEDLDSVAVTYAPGLLGALVVGVSFAKGAAWALDVPLVCVNHLEGHLYANRIDAPDFEPPAVVSLVSGGNTMLVHMRGWGDYGVLGETIDDAVGEAFDKVAKALGLGYPGGPVISREAARGRADAIDFPRAMLHSHDLRFSLSGLKTAVMNHISGERNAGRELNVPDIAASFQQAVIDVQVAKARSALEQTGAPAFCLGGGVAANPALREAYEEMCADMGVRLVMPPVASCGDNAGMIALAALDRFRTGKFAPLDIDAQAHADLSEPY